MYGDTVERQHGLRLHKDGKLKYSTINGEVFPPDVSNAQVPASGASLAPEGYRFVFGHLGFSVAPTFLLFGTLWLRQVAVRKQKCIRIWLLPKSTIVLLLWPDVFTY